MDRSRKADDMIDKTIQEIEARLRQADSLPAEKREELLGLFSTLRAEVVEISEEHGDTARDIAGHSDRSTSELTSTAPDRDRLQASIDGLSGSVSGFEESHPKLVQAVNRICVTLSNLGI